MDRRATEPAPGYRLYLWGTISCLVIGGLALGFEHFVVGGVFIVAAFIGAFARATFCAWYDHRLVSQGVVIDRSEWYRGQLQKGDRHAKWVAMYALGSMLLIGVIVIGWAIAKAT